MAPHTEGSSRRHRVLKRVGWGAAFTLLGLLFTLLIAFAAVNTDRGHRWLTGIVNRHFAGELLPGLRLGSLEGTVPFSFTVRGVTVDQPSRGLSAHVEAVHLETELLALARGTLRLSTVEVTNPEVRVGEPKPVPPPPGLEVDDSPSKLAIAVEQLTVSGGRVEVSRADVEVTLAELSAQADVYREASDGVLMVNLHSAAAKVQVAGEESPATASAFFVALPERLNGWLTAQANTTPETRITARVLGPMEALDVWLKATGPKLDRLVVDATLDVPERGWRGTLDLDGDSLSANAAGHGTGGAFDAQLSATASGLGPVQVQGRTLALDGDVKLEAHRAVSGKLSVSGSLDLERASAGEVTVRSLAAQLSAHATPAARTGELTLDVEQPFELNGVGVAPTRLHATSDGRALSASLSTALMAGGDARRPLKAQATLPLADRGLKLDRQEPVSAHVEWSGVSLGALARVAGLDEPLEGRLSLRADAEGTLASPKVDASLRLDRVAAAGRRGLFARAELSAAEHTELELTAGASGDVLLRASGTLEQGLGDVLEPRSAWLDAPLRLQVEVPRTTLARLARLQPSLGELEGHAGANLTVTGTARAPRLEGALRGAAGPPGGQRTPLALDLHGRVDDGASTVDFDGRVAGARVEGSAGSALTPAEVLLGEASGPALWARARAEGLRLAGVSKLAPTLPPLSGTVDARLSVSRVPSAPRVELQLDGTRVAIASRAPGALSLSVKLDGAKLDATGRYTQAKGGAELEARLDRRGQAHARVALTRLDLAGVRRWRPKLPLARDEASGTVTLDGRVAATGRAKSPLARLTGSGQVSGTVIAEGLDVAAYLARPTASPKQQPGAPTAAAGGEVKELVRGLRRGRAFHLERLAVKESRVALIDATSPRRPALDLREVALTVENLASGREAMRGVPVVITARALVEGSGEVVAFATADPFAKPLVATGRAVLKGLELSDVRELLRTYGVVAPEGTFSCYAALHLKGERLDGGIKPIFTDVDIDPAPSASWGEAALAELADFAGDVLGEEGPRGGDRVATIVPIKGELSVVGPQVVPAVLVAMRNAFVVGLTRGFMNLPLKTAAGSQSLFTQAAQALQADEFPKAQPRGGP